jgi:hypothetical protein
MAGGTPFSEEVWATILNRIAEGESLRTICADEDMPSRVSVYRWLEADEALRDQYARAREEQADTLFDEILEIADDGRNDWMERNGEEDRGWRENGEALGRARLRIDARKWMAGKLRPKKYGERLALAGDGDAPLTVVIAPSDADL